MAASLASNIAFTQPKLTNSRAITGRSYVSVRCGPRSNRGPLVKGRILSIEAIQAVQALKRARRGNGATDLDTVLSKTVSRLIKSDLVAAFNELLRQDQIDLVLRVFSAVRSEYKVNPSQYADLVAALTSKGMTEDIDRLICELEEEEEFDYDDKGTVGLIKALIAAERVEPTVKIYRLMKKSGWGPNRVEDDHVAELLSTGLRRLGAAAVADEIDREFNSITGILDKVSI